MSPARTEDDVSTWRILVAEDEPLVAEVVENDLRTLGATVIARAANGQQALELAAQLKPSAVLMDVQMPVLDGISAAKELMTRSPCPVVALTVHDERDIATRAVDAGIGAYLVKPSTPEALWRAIAIARARFDDMQALRAMNLELQRALETVKQLSGLLPICMGCKRIRDDTGDWQKIEKYITEHSEAQLTHSICDECMETMYPEG